MLWMVATAAPVESRRPHGSIQRAPLDGAASRGVLAGARRDPGDVLGEVAAGLGWPAPLRDERAPVWRAGLGPLSAEIAIVGHAERCAPLDQLAAEGLCRGLFHGWPAVICRDGDRLRSGGLAHGGLTAWRGGPYVCQARDASGRGGEVVVAEALHQAMQRHLLGGLPSSVIILAETDDVPGHGSLAVAYRFRRAVDLYYAANGCGRVAFDWMILDADGPEGANDWHTVGPELAPFIGHEESLALAAIQRALGSMALPPDVYLERIVVMVPWDADPMLDALDYWVARGDTIAVAGADGATRLYVPNLIVVSEGDEVGVWCHEVGHSLVAEQGATCGRWRLPDLYDVPDGETQRGDVGAWGLMGDWSDDPRLYNSPPHMCSPTKAMAGWLGYCEAEMGGEYDLVPLEDQRPGDAVLRLDDPASDDPGSYYVIEARDTEAPYGAPGRGIMVYHVAHADEGGPPDIRALPGVTGTMDTPTLSATIGQRVAIGQAASGGFTITLVDQSDAPYRARVRISPVEARHGVSPAAHALRSI